MAVIKIRLEYAISEIVVAGTDLESGAEASDVEEEEEEKVQQQVSAEFEPQAATSGRLPTWGPPQGTEMFILLSVQQMV
jgi:hypothetical protein